MRRLRPMLIAATPGLVCAGFLLMVGNRDARFHARSFLKMEVRETHLFPMILPRRSQCRQQLPQRGWKTTAPGQYEENQ